MHVRARQLSITLVLRMKDVAVIKKIIHAMCLAEMFRSKCVISSRFADLGHGEPQLAVVHIVENAVGWTSFRLARDCRCHQLSLQAAYCVVITDACTGSATTVLKLHQRHSWSQLTLLAAAAAVMPVASAVVTV